MNVKVITRHAPSNYGSLLQAYATVRVINSLGHDCAVIDYRRPDEQGLKGFMTELAKKPRWNSSSLRRWLYVALRYPAEWYAARRFESMRRRMLTLTRRIDSPDGLAALDADILLTGSDQVWGPVGGVSHDPAYFLDFARRDVRRVAYAASFGRTDFNDSMLKRFGPMIASYDAIAVRESSAANLIESMGCERPDQVLDPTLLLSRDNWLELADKRPANGARPYVLVYQLHNNPALDRYAARCARRLGLPLLRVSAALHQMSRSGRLQWLPDAARFMALIRDASLMVTDSFHGTAFAINFNTQFIEILPGNGTSARNMSLLQLCGLTDRIAASTDDFSLLDHPIDYTPVNGIIAAERSRSMQVLADMLSKMTHHNENT